LSDEAFFDQVTSKYGDPTGFTALGTKAYWTLDGTEEIRNKIIPIDGADALWSEKSPRIG